MSKIGPGKASRSAVPAPSKVRPAPSKIGGATKKATSTMKPTASQAGGTRSVKGQSLAGQSTGRRSATSRTGVPRGEPQTWNPATWSRRRRVICVISGSGAILFLMSVIFTLVISSLFLRQEVIRNTITPLKWPETTAPSTPFTTTTEPVFTGSFHTLPRNLSKWCQDLTRDPCAYYKQKYVTDCRKMKCSTVSIKLVRDITLRHDGIVSARLEFRIIPDEEYNKPMTPPQGALCKLPGATDDTSESSFGRCRNQECDSASDPTIRQYLKFSPVNGRMVDASMLDKNECFDSGPEIVSSFPILGVTQCGKTKVYDRCVRHPIILQKCTAPEMGGKTCYGEGTLPFVQPDQVPLTFGPRCSCESEYDHFQNMLCNDGLKNKTRCGFMIDGTDKSFGDLVDDFFGCCLSDTPNAGRAMCIAGNCIKPNFR